MGEEVVFFDDSAQLPEGVVYHSIVDIQASELAEIRNPSIGDQNQLILKAKEVKATESSIFVYYPWRNCVVEMLNEACFMAIKTNRNKLLITEEEQHKLYNSTLSIAGMSVGSSLLYGLVGTGIGNNFYIADNDTFSNANLNRVQATIFDIGKKKTAVACRKSLEMNPFLTVSPLDGDVTTDKIDSFLGFGKTQIIFEEIDDFKMKVNLRLAAKRHKIPFVMLTNLGDSVQVDIERYDQDENYPLFHGFVPNETIQRILQLDAISDDEMKKLAVELVDKNLVPQRAISSLQQIGVTLVGRPQLYSTVAIDGGIAPYIARKILLGDPLQSGRYVLKLDSMEKL